MPLPSFFPTDRVVVLAHRGLARDVPENSLAAFRKALAAGADVLESDVRASSDGVAVFVHDETLQRVYGDSRAVRDLTYEQLRAIVPNPELAVVSVHDALLALPEARFNIDIKSRDVVEPFASTIHGISAVPRVLVASFSQSRRRATTRLIAGVATSESAPGVAVSVVLCWLGLPRLAAALVRGQRILQIPTKVLGIDVTNRRLVARLHRAGFTVQFWTINASEDIRRIVASGADGIVTDYCDVAVPLCH